MQVDSLCPICKAWYAGPAGHRCLGSPLHQVQAERDNSKRLLGELNQKMLDTLIALTAERERSARLEADAVRYRWLRNHPGYMGWEHDFRADEIDTAVDREMAIEAALTPTAKKQT